MSDFEAKTTDKGEASTGQEDKHPDSRSIQHGQSMLSKTSDTVPESPYRSDSNMEQDRGVGHVAGAEQSVSADNLSRASTQTSTLSNTVLENGHPLHNVIKLRKSEKASDYIATRVFSNELIKSKIDLLGNESLHALKLKPLPRSPRKISGAYTAIKELAEMRADNARLEEDLEVLQIQNRQLRYANTELEKDLQVEKDLKGVSHIVHKYERVLGGMRDEMDLYRDTVYDLESQNTKLQLDHEKLVAAKDEELRRLAEETQELKTIIATQRQTIARSAFEITEMTERNVEDIAAVEVITTKFEAIKASLLHENAETEDKDEQIAVLQDRVKDLEERAAHDSGVWENKLKLARALCHAAADEPEGKKAYFDTIMGAVDEGRLAVENLLSLLEPGGR